MYGTGVIEVMSAHNKTLYLLVVILLFVTCPIAVQAGKDSLDPNWSVEIKGGKFYPELDQWEDYYDKEYMWHFSAAIAWKPIRNIDVGLEIGRTRDGGRGSFPIQGGQGGRVVYTLYPVSVYAVLRGVYSEQQWLVPYVGAGKTRIYYDQNIRSQENVEGSTDGVYYKAGLQFLLDRIDKASASKVQAAFGVENTYFIIEAQKINAEVNGVELGGDSYLLGLLFEF